MKRLNVESVDQHICGTVWTSRLSQQLMEEISYNIGPRPPGSKAMKEAQKYLAANLEKLEAVNVHTEPVPVLAWQDAPSELELISPRKRSYESVQCVHSASSSLTAPLWDAGTASQEDLDRIGRRVEGAVLLIGGHTISGVKYVPLPQQVQWISERGAAGILLGSMYQVAGCPAIELATVKKSALPVLGISYEAARELSSAAQREALKVRIKSTGESFQTRCSNLTAEIGPSKGGCESILLGAHLDSFHLNPGSLDNLTGVVTLMEVVRALAPLQAHFKRRLVVVIYTGEEYGFVGSLSYVRRHVQELDSIRFVFNMDTLFPATAEGVAVMWSPEMKEYIQSGFCQTQRRVDVRNLFCMSSDYLPFLLEGIPAARPADWQNSMPVWSHTAMDTPDKIHFDWLRMNAMTFAQLLARMLIDTRPLPAKRKSPAEVESLLAEEQVTEAIRSFGLLA